MYLDDNTTTCYKCTVPLVGIKFATDMVLLMKYSRRSGFDKGYYCARSDNGTGYIGNGIYLWKELFERSFMLLAYQWFFYIKHSVQQLLLFIRCFIYWGISNKCTSLQIYALTELTLHTLVRCCSFVHHDEFNEYKWYSYHLIIIIIFMIIIIAVSMDTFYRYQ